MSESQQERLLQYIRGLIGKWAIAIISTVVCISFGAGVFANDQRRESIETRALMNAQFIVMNTKLDDLRSHDRAQAEALAVRLADWSNWRIAVTETNARSTAMLQSHETWITYMQRKPTP